MQTLVVKFCHLDRSLSCGRRRGYTCGNNVPCHFQKIPGEDEGIMSTYGDKEMGEGMCYPNCTYAGKFHAAENDCNCNHPETGDVFFCATHHITGYPPCPKLSGGPE